jgi:hypothetical protein
MYPWHGHPPPPPPCINDIMSQIKAASPSLCMALFPFVPMHHHVTLCLCTVHHLYSTQSQSSLTALVTCTSCYCPVIITHTYTLRFVLRMYARLSLYFYFYFLTLRECARLCSFFVFLVCLFSIFFVFFEGGWGLLISSWSVTASREAGSVRLILTVTYSSSHGFSGRYLQDTLMCCNLRITEECTWCCDQSHIGCFAFLTEIR